MNIKNFLGITPISNQTPKVSSVEKPIKSSEASSEKDANGQEFYSKKQHKEKMTEEQFQSAVALLKEKQFMKDMNWMVEVVLEGEIRYAWVKDQAGASIRKIAEYDLWEVFDTTHQIPNKGQLLKRTA
ncbi:MAG: hypothetical protein A2622_03185 [Bdellovibrionales bacterium RIFCSPHIGHO2_01_FULL_40_29]|nr:MAG: hypothetical protein A2622_03185 [Bdellovibrionales bacterium RIFCSPHIGHO2_01_FULL_40_29]OFZ34077.1 MAG: hypothetical protein A3D17_03605 [Bdellovibrionales bacterium RIFCSPHIGHO2_02_FULL_40_15]